MWIEKTFKFTLYYYIISIKLNYYLNIKCWIIICRLYYCRRTRAMILFKVFRGRQNICSSIIRGKKKKMFFCFIIYFLTSPLVIRGQNWHHWTGVLYSFNNNYCFYCTILHVIIYKNSYCTIIIIKNVMHQCA